MTDTASTTTSTTTDADTEALAAAEPAVAASAAQEPRMEQVDPSLLLVDRNVRRDAAPDTHTGTVACAALTATDRLAAVEQLSAFGVSAAQITRRLKTKRTQVDAALAVAASPLAKKATERYEFLSLDQAAVLAEFDAGDDADTVKALVACAKDSPGQFAHAAQRARDDQATRAREQAARDAIAASGVTVLSGRAPSRYGPAGGPERLLADLTNPQGEPLTPAGHAACPGHGAHLAVE